MSIQGRRTLGNYEIRERAMQAAWGLVWAILFRPSPRLAWSWRNVILRSFGAKLGPAVRVFPTVRVFSPWNLTIGEGTSIGDGAILYNLGPLTLGKAVTISQRAHLCGGTHDYRKSSMPLIKAPISVGNGVWVAAEAFVGPNVTVGERSVVGARAVVVRDVPVDTIVVGNPAKVVKTWRATAE